MNRSAAVGAIVWLSLMACPAVAQQTFEGYDCTSDCSGHQAGYDWAERNDISDADDCDGNSQSSTKAVRLTSRSNRQRLMMKSPPTKAMRTAPNSRLSAAATYSGR